MPEMTASLHTLSGSRMKLPHNSMLYDLFGRQNVVKEAMKQMTVWSVCDFC